MKSRLPCYDKYDDTKLLWAPKLPSHWQILRNGRLFSQRVETGYPDLPILEVSLRTGVRVRDMSNIKRKQVMSDKEKYKRADKGDIAYNMMRMWQGAVGIAPVDGLISPAYVVARPFPEANSCYYSYLFRTDDYKDEVNKYSRGIVSDRNRLYWNEFKQMPSIVPPRDEQDKIVAYLRAQDAHIARFIKIKRELIDLLSEQKQTLIHQAVTRGINPNVKLKPSGVDWLGEIPEHWIIKPLKWWVRINERTLAERTDPNYEFQYIDIGTVKTGRLIKQPKNLFFSKSPSRARRLLQKGDTIVSTVRTYLKAIWYVNVESEHLVASTGFAVFSPHQSVEPEYLGYVIQTQNFIDRVAANSNGIAYPAISESVLSRFKIAIPPTKDEQKLLIKSIKFETSPLDDAITKATNEIELILEYRERLITDAVTGQIDVRNWQPGPDDDVENSELTALSIDGLMEEEEEYEHENN